MEDDTAAKNAAGPITDSGEAPADVAPFVIADEAAQVAPDEDDELEALEREVRSLQELNRLREMQSHVVAEEGTRKGDRPAVAPGGATNASSGDSSGKTTSIFVGNLDLRTMEDELRIIFMHCGSIRRVTLVKDKSTGQPKGMAYIEFEGEDAIQKALLKNHQQLHGKPIKVAIKRDNIAGMGRAGAMQNPFAAGRGNGGIARGATPAAGGGGVLPYAMMQQMMQQMMQRGGMGSSPMRGRGFGRGGRARGAM